MGRLIDADKLLEETRRDRDYARKNGFLDMYYERQVLIDRIEAQPTAYDPDKVVEQLEEIKTGANTNCKMYCNDYDWSTVAYQGLCEEYLKKRAIEIVKAGGKDDTH